MKSRIVKTWLGMCGAVLLFAGAISATAQADQIILKNGDRLTGTIDSADGGKLNMTSPFAGKVTVDLKDVKTFSTDGPIKILMSDGTILNEKIIEGPDGSFTTASGGLLASQAIPLSSIEKINPPRVVWTGSIVVNGLLTQGDTSSKQFGATLDATRRAEDDRILAGAGYLFGSQKINNVESTTQDNWFIRGEYDYFFSKQLFGYANVRVEKDRIQHLDLRLTPGVGAGYQVVERPDFNLNLTGGLAWVYEDFSTLPTPNENVSLRLGYHVDKTLWDSKLKVFSDTAYFPSVQNISNYLILFDAGLRMSITKTMFSELKAEVDYDSKPAPTSHRTDTKYILGVGWTF